MTDLDTATLRLALKAPGDPSDPVDVNQIVTRGRRLRQRRRLTAVAGGICAVAILAGTGTAIANLTAAPSAPGQPVGPAQHRPAQHQSAQHRPPQPAPSRHGTPVPVVRPTTNLPATRAPAATPTPANVTPTPSASPTSTAAPTGAFSPASVASAVPTRSLASTSPRALAPTPTRAGRAVSA
jgi:hypothetical protein